MSGNDVTPARYPNQYDKSKYAIQKSTGTFTLSNLGYYFDCEIVKRDSEYYAVLSVDNKHNYNYGEDEIDEYITDDFYTED